MRGGHRGGHHHATAHLRANARRLHGGVGGEGLLSLGIHCPDAERWSAVCGVARGDPEDASGEDFAVAVRARSLSPK